MNITLTGILPIPEGQTPSDQVTYTLDNVPFPPPSDPAKAPQGLSPPPNGLTLLYGQRVGMVGLAQVRAMLAQSNLRTVPVTVTLSQDIGASSHYQKTDLKKTRILHLDRLSADLRDRVVDLFEGYAASEGIPFVQADGATVHERFEVVMYRPHLIARLREERDFKHLAVICYPVLTAGKLTKRATLFNADVVESVSCQFFNNLTIELPHRLGKRSAPKASHRRTG